MPQKLSKMPRKLATTKDLGFDHSMVNNSVNMTPELSPSHFKLKPRLDERPPSQQRIINCTT